MDIPEYKSNSNRYKQEQRTAEREPEKRVDKIVKGTAKTKRKSEARKFFDKFIADDAESIKSHVVGDIIVPAIKDSILGTIETLLGYNKRSRNRSARDIIGYTNYSEPSRRYSSRAEDPRSRVGNDFEDVIVDTKGEAEDVLAQLEAIIDKYKVARVTDLYDLVGLTAPYTGNRYGWTDIHTAESIRLRDGSYLIKLPRAMPID